MRVGWVYHPFFLRHRTGLSHPDQPARLKAIRSGLERAGLLSRMVPLEFGAASPRQLELVHDPAYVALVGLACEEGMSFIGASDTRICAESHDVARLASGGVLAACDAAARGEIDGAFCAVRPPGHHAGPDQAGGYCLYNHVALGAEYLRRHHGLPRIAIVDWDVHHGNGTQRIFEARPDVLYISLHESPDLLYPHTGYALERGRGAGEGATINIPMRPGSGDGEYHRAFREAVLPAVDAFGPAAVLISAGFDAAAADGTAHINLEPLSFGWMTRELAGHVQSRSAACPVISVLEGGYDSSSLGRCVVEHVRAMLDCPGIPSGPGGVLPL